MAFKAIRLDSGSGLSATFVPGAGMICVSLVCDGKEYLDQRGGLGDYVQSGSTMALPILYPWANRLARDSWKFGPQPARIDPDAYHVKRDENGLAIHGTLTASSFWEVGQASTDEDLASASLKARLDFASHPELTGTFPFPHLLELEFLLLGRSLTVRTSVTPTGDLAVPLAYGFHPYLTLPDSGRGDWKVRLPGMTSLETDSRHIPTGNRSACEPQEFDLEDRDLDDAFAEVRPGANFSVEDQQARITVTFNRGFGAAQVFSPAGSDFICFEPMKAPTNALVSGRDLTSVNPGQTDVAEFTIEITEPTPTDDPQAAVAATGASNRVPAVGDSARTGEFDRAVSARYRLGPGDPAEEVRRVAMGRVDSAVSRLRNSPPEERADAVHTARKDMKKLRSVLTLVRGEIGKKTCRRETLRFGKAARRLSETRDAEVLAATLASVLEDYPDDAPSVAGLVADLERRRHSVSAAGGGEPLENAMAEVADEIEAGGRRIEAWPLESADWSMFEAGLTRSYRGGRKALASVEVQIGQGTLPDPGKVHSFRKRVKELWYELRLLRDAWPEGLKGPVKEAGRLADLLGDYNDLSILLDQIESRLEAGVAIEPEGPEDLSALVETIEGRQLYLLSEGLPAARRLYAEAPEAFAARIGSYWSA